MAINNVFVSFQLLYIQINCHTSILIAVAALFAVNALK